MIDLALYELADTALPEELHFLAQSDIVRWLAAITGMDGYAATMLALDVQIYTCGSPGYLEWSAAYDLHSDGFVVSPDLGLCGHVR